MITETISVPEVHCDHCVNAIEGALEPRDGVADASVDLEARAVTVTYDEDVVGVDDIVATIEDQGYEVPAR
jgi:copper chaperone